MVEINGIVALNGGVAKTFDIKTTVNTPKELEALREQITKKYNNKYNITFITRKHPAVGGHWA